MSRGERALVVSVAHAVNELNVLRKLVLLASNADRTTKWQKDAHTCQLLVITRVLTGKLYESWQVVRQTYFDSKLSLTYGNKLTADGTEALARLGKYFGRADTTVKSVRNQFAFHYSQSHLGEAAADDTDNDELSLYFSETSGNVLYYFAEHIAGGALLRTIDPQSTSLAFGKLLVEIAEVTLLFNTFAQSLIAAILDHGLPGDKNPISVKEQVTHHEPHASEVSLPFYIDFADFPPNQVSAA